jgi:hypothetical protein
LRAQSPTTTTTTMQTRVLHAMLQVYVKSSRTDLADRNIVSFAALDSAALLIRGFLWQEK